MAEETELYIGMAQRLEKDLHREGLDTNVCLASIAISMKRIADTLEAQAKPAYLVDTTQMSEADRKRIMESMAPGELIERPKDPVAAAINRLNAQLDETNRVLTVIARNVDRGGF